MSREEEISTLLNQLNDLDCKCERTDQYDVDWDKCLEIVSKLENLDQEKVIDILIEMLKLTLDFEFEDTINAILNKLKSNSGKIRKKQMRTLASIFMSVFEGKTKPNYREVQDWDTDELNTLRYREEILELIGKLDEEIAVPIALDKITFEYNFKHAHGRSIDGEGIREASAEILGKYKIKEGIRALATRLDDCVEAVAVKAAWALGEIGKKEAYPFLLKYISGNVYIPSPHYEDYQEHEFGPSGFVHFPKLEKEVRLSLEKLGIKIDDKLVFTGDLLFECDEDYDSDSNLFYDYPAKTYEIIHELLKDNAFKDFHSCLTDFMKDL